MCRCKGRKKNDIPFWFLFRVLDLLYGFCLRPEWMDGELVFWVDGEYGRARS